MPSMVTTGRSPTADTGRTHERAAAPPICTVQAPQALIPQPYFVPVILSSSRKTQRSGVDGSTFTSRRSPLTLSWYAVMIFPFLQNTVYSHTIQRVLFCQQ